ESFFTEEAQSWRFPLLAGWSSRITAAEIAVQLSSAVTMVGARNTGMRIRVTMAILSFVLSLVGRAGAEPPVRRPLVAVIGENEGTEITDFVVPYGVLTASGVVDVVDVSVHPGPITMLPGMKLAATETAASFDAKHPSGANFVIVPAVHRPTDPTLLEWLRSQARRGATIVGVCDGVQVVAAAGLLEHRSATGHWYSFSTLEK